MDSLVAEKGMGPTVYKTFFCPINSGVSGRCFSWIACAWMVSLRSPNLSPCLVRVVAWGEVCWANCAS